MSDRNLVDLVVAGPPKSGTSWLYAHLAAHPGIDPAHAKEPLFFSTDRGLDLGAPDGPLRSGGHDRGRAWFESLFDSSTGAVRLEGSTDYFASPSAPALLTAAAPDVHVVVCLREPAARLVSQYWHERRATNLPDLGEMVRDGHPRLTYWRACSSLGAGLERWLEAVPAHRIHLVGFNEVSEDVRVPANRILAAVGLPPLAEGLVPDEDVANVAGTARLPRLQRLLTLSRARRVAEELPVWLRKPLRGAARTMANANIRREVMPPADPETLATLHTSFADDHARLEGLLSAHWPDLLVEVQGWPTS